MANSRSETRKIRLVWEKTKGEKGYVHSLELSQPPQVLVSYCGGVYICPQTPSYASLQEVELSPLSFECGLNDSPSKIIERKSRNFSAVKPAGHHLNQVIKFNIASEVLLILISCITGRRKWEEHFTSVLFFLQIHNPRLFMGGGGTEHCQIKGHSTICLTNLFQKCQGHEK